MADVVVIVDANGKEHEFPAGFDPKVAAQIVREGSPSAPLTRLGSAKTGGMARDTAPWDPSEFVGGMAENFNPMNYVRAAKHLLTTDPRESIPEIASGTAQQFKGLLDGDARTAGQIAGGFLTGPTLGASGRVLRKGAPALMDMGLQRTMAQRLEFPGAPQRLVDEGIVPTGNNIQRALDTTEGHVKNAAQAYDAAHPISPVDPDTIARSAQDFAHKEGKVGGLGNVPGPEAAELDALAKDYLDHNTRTRSLEETIDQKRSYGDRSRYSSRPNAPTQTNEAANFNKGVTRANRQEALRLDPKIEGLLSKEQDLLGALTAQMERDAKSTPPTTVGMAKALMGLRNPTVMGSAAVAADRGGQALERLDPIALRAALARLMASHDVNGHR